MASFGSCVQVCHGATCQRTTGHTRLATIASRWRQAGIWDQIMEALAAAHDGAVQMIDTSVVRVHQHGACIPGNREKHAWANIPPTRTRKEPICFSLYLYRGRIPSNGSSTRSGRVGVSSTATTKLAANYLAFIKLAAIRIWLRAPDNRHFRDYPLTGHDADMPKSTRMTRSRHDRCARLWQQRMATARCRRRVLLNWRGFLE
jgi:transposase